MVVTFKDLSLPLKIAVIASFVYAVEWFVGFMLSFARGYYGMPM